MPEHQLPASGHRHQATPASKALPDGAALLPQKNQSSGSAARSPEGHAEINLASESVAGEEDPGASLDTPPGVNS